MPHALPAALPPGARPAPRGRTWSARAAAVLGGALTLVTGTVAVVGAGAASAAAPASGDTVITVSGTVEQVVVDTFHAADGHHAAEGELVLDTSVRVGGEVYDVPESAVQRRPGSADTVVRSGDPVDVTISAAAGLDAQRALAATQDATAPAARVLSVTAEPSTAAVASTAVRMPALGVHALTVLPVHWGTPGGVTRASLSTVATQAAQYWAEQSGGRLTFAPTVRDWVQIPNPGSCDTNGIMRDALAAHGVPRGSGTSHVAVYFPPRADCGGWAGMGSISGPNIWINGVPTVDVLAHELGHNLGVGHANTATCRSGGVRVSLSDDCDVSPYADIADVMGFGTTMATGNLNTALADRLGFAEVLEVTDLPATVDVARLSDVGATRAVKLATASGTVYVDFRPAQGRDVRRTAWAGVQVHRVVGTSYPESQLLDMQPTRTAFSAPALPVGGSWTVPGTGRTLTVTATSATTATLSVTGAAGAPATPTPAPTPTPTPGTPTTPPVALGEDLTFVPVAPARVLDTRETGTPLGALERRDVVVGGRGGVPADARAVVVNLTAVGATAQTHLRAWPAGGTVSPSSVLNTDPGRVAATGVMLGVGSGRAVTVYNEAGRVHLLADVTGYYVTTGGLGFESLATSARVLDTRAGSGAGAIPHGGTRTVAVAGRNGVPADAAAVVVNVTSVGARSDGYVAAHPAGGTAPGTSTVNHVPGVASTNRAVVKLGGGALSVRVGGAPAHVLVDVVGWFGPSGRKTFTPITPVRAFDTRATGLALGTGQARSFDVRTAAGAGTSGTSAGTAVMVVTATGASAPETFVTVWDGLTARPQTSDLNVRAGTDQANLVLAPWTTTGAVRLYNDLGDVHLIGDVLGYFS